MRGLWKTRLRAQLLDEIYRLSAIDFREVLMKRAGLLGGAFLHFLVRSLKRQNPLFLGYRMNHNIRGEGGIRLFVVWGGIPET
jgi:hypothetical protein